MKTLDEVLNAWDADAPMDMTEPGKELARVPNLLAKYLRARSNHRLRSKNAYYGYRDLRRDKWIYYRGDQSPELLKKYNWEPFGAKLLKEEIKDYLEADADLNKLMIKKDYHDEIVATLETIIKELNQRTWQIRGIADWDKYTRGVG